MKPAPPVTSARMARRWSSGRGRQPAQEIEHGVADREMPDLDEAVAVRCHVEVPLALAAQRVVGRETAECRDRAAGGDRGVDRVEDVGGATRTGNGDDEVAGAGVELDLL